MHSSKHTKSEKRTVKKDYKSVQPIGFVPLCSHICNDTARCVPLSAMSPARYVPILAKSLARYVTGPLGPRPAMPQAIDVAGPLCSHARYVTGPLCRGPAISHARYVNGPLCPRPVMSPARCVTSPLCRRPAVSSARYFPEYTCFQGGSISKWLYYKEPQNQKPKTQTQTNHYFCG